MISIRNEIARQTTAHKLKTLRSQKEILEQKQSVMQEGKFSGNQLNELVKKADVIQSFRLTEDEKLQSIANDLRLFVRTQERAKQTKTGAVQEWHKVVDDEMSLMMQKADHALLFCDVLQEWLDVESTSNNGNNRAGTSTSPSSKTDKIKESWNQMMSSIGKHHKEDSPDNTEERKYNVKAYLEKNHLHPDVMAALAKISESAKEHSGKDMGISPARVKEAMLKLASDARMYSPELRKQLQEESKKSMVLDELSSALTATWRSIEDWKWPQEGVEEVLQTHLNGKQRWFLQLDIVTSILFQIIGDYWTEFYFTELKQLRQRKELWEAKGEFERWSTRNAEQSHEEIAKRMEILAREGEDDNLSKSNMFDAWERSTKKEGKGKMDNAYRRNRSRRRRSSAPTTDDNILDRAECLLEAEDIRSLSHFGMILAPQEKSGLSNYDGDIDSDNDEDENDDLRWSNSSEKTSSWGASANANRPAKAYDRIYRWISAQITLIKSVDPSAQMAFLHGDLENFGPSIPHEVSMEVMEFFGLPDRWLHWMRHYLQTPIRDRKAGTITIRTKGTPFGQAFSALANELLLVLLDFVVVTNTQYWIDR